MNVMIEPETVWMINPAISMMADLVYIAAGLAGFFGILRVRRTGKGTVTVGLAALICLALPLGSIWLEDRANSNPESFPESGLGGPVDTYTASSVARQLEAAGIVSGHVVTTRNSLFAGEQDHLDPDLDGKVADACRKRSTSTLRVANIVKTDGTVVDGVLNIVPGEEQCNISLAEK